MMGVMEPVGALAPTGPRHILVSPRAPAGASAANCRYLTWLVRSPPWERVSGP